MEPEKDQEIENGSASIEAKGPIITTMIQILDSRRAIEEAVNVRQLTYIALVHVPLSFCASIFSMGGSYALGQDRFGIYFATALPLTVLSLAISVYAAQIRVTWGSVSGLWSLGSGRIVPAQLPV